MSSAVRLISALVSLTLSVSGYAEVFTGAPGMRFVKIPTGEFLMGTSNLDPVLAEMQTPNPRRVRDETPSHKVVIPEPFYLGETEVTQQQWLAVMGTRPGPYEYWQHSRWPELPVVSVTWHDVQRFIEALNEQSDTVRYRLPTEAEWEYAARAGTTGIRPFPIEEMDEHVWYILTSYDEVQPVGELQPNPWGLYDMLGNVWEWVQDWYAPEYYARSPTIDPQGPEDGSKRVRRGGSYHCQLPLVRPAYRAADAPDVTYSVVGFRLVAEPQSKRQSVPVRHDRLDRS